MNLEEALLLGALQGLTEWLPISSSAHLIVLQDLLSSRSLPFNAMVHGGTLLSVLLVFRAEVTRTLRGFLRSFSDMRAGRSLSEESRLAWYVLLGTLPAASVGFLLADQIEASFTKPVAALGLLLNSLLLYSTRWAKRGGSLDARRALLIGAAQSASLIPGISRSGSAIAAGLISGLSREEALSYSFLLSVPIIAGALMLEALRYPSEVLSLENIAGFLSSFSVGLLAIRSLIPLVRRGKLHWFSYYCLSISVLALLNLI